MHESVSKVPKVLTFGKVSKKIQKSWGLGGADQFWTMSKLKRQRTVSKEEENLIISEKQEEHVNCDHR